MGHVAELSLLVVCFVASAASEQIKYPAKAADICGPNCPAGWVKFNGRCFSYIPKSVNWVTAEAECLKLGGNLVSMHSISEYQLVKALIRANDPKENPTWIGLHDCPKRFTWLWSDGTKFDYSRWNVNEPNNLNSECCVHLNWSGEKNWNDIPCELQYPFVCVKRLVSMSRVLTLLLQQSKLEPPKFGNSGGTPPMVGGYQRDMGLSDARILSELPRFLTDLEINPVTDQLRNPVKRAAEEKHYCKPSCPYGWVHFDGRCFSYFGNTLDWTTAEAYCINLAANLVSIHSENEYQMVKALIRVYDPAEKPTWIGLSNCQKKNSWVWSDGTRFRYSKWNSKEPNHSGGECCVHINWESQKNWNDIPCNKVYPFVCVRRL
ncbi:C-type mannose receptor 2-like [Salminus brasiliensis]|uniref:C-type mannose receptor 2-like n=1 Tax=Salminus brasiliensis TaxID=930266 RepID=UPI003B838144